MCASAAHSHSYLHFDPAVHRLQDLSVVDGMDLDQESQAFRYCRGKYKGERMWTQRLVIV